MSAAWQPEKLQFANDHVQWLLEVPMNWEALKIIAPCSATQAAISLLANSHAHHARLDADRLKCGTGMCTMNPK